MSHDLDAVRGRSVQVHHLSDLLGAFFLQFIRLLFRSTGVFQDLYERFLKLISGQEGKQIFAGIFPVEVFVSLQGFHEDKHSDQLLSHDVNAAVCEVGPDDSTEASEREK